MASGGLCVFEPQTWNPCCVEDGHLPQRGSGECCLPLVVLFVGMNFAFPQFTAKGREVGQQPGQQSAGDGRGSRREPAKSGIVNSQQAHITALDGTVRVKKASSNSWVTADYNVPLEKGDVVQTGSEGMAKIVFNDGTNYTVKQDSLIVIEENSANDQQQTNVAVAVSTGTVDLSTATYVQGSKSQVIVAGATASLAPDSAAMVRNDPKADQHEILVKKGTGEITRNGEVVHLADWEKVSFPGAIAAHGEGEGNRAADADFAGQHDADFYRGRRPSRWSFPGRRWRMRWATGCAFRTIRIFLRPSWIAR